ncbi:MAG TPA: histidine kinase [Verrucomicrobiae bacterium]
MFTGVTTMKQMTSFAETGPPELEPPAARASKTNLRRLSETLNRRTLELAAAKVQLQWRITRRKSAEAALRESGARYAKLLKASVRLQESLRRSAHQLLAAQENERATISRELHDDVAQTLLGINVRLLSLKQEAGSNPKDFPDKIASTQRLVASSARLMRLAARQFRVK